MSKPKIVLWDIETGYNAVALFSLRDKNNAYISHHNLLSERYIICASWKFAGEKKVHSVSVLDDKERFKRDPHDDTFVVKKLREVLADADVIVHHNGDRFDVPSFNARAIYHGLPPLPLVTSIDTLTVARKKFYFNSNRLDYLAKLFGFEGKLGTSAGLWMRAFKGDKKAIREMEVYNKQDVVTLEQVYDKLRPWIEKHPNMGLYTTGEHPVCPNCGSEHLVRQGYRRTLTRKYMRFHCVDCGKYSKSKHSEPIKNILTDG